uniref:Uncharacterized protein n=1 Tax=Anguilla anguilla TaxID=7936 RepID=A0A0E9XLK0_ANGAN
MRQPVCILVKGGAYFGRYQEILHQYGEGGMGGTRCD